MMVGPDYASVDGNLPPDWPRVKTKASFAIVRATYSTYVDPTFKRDWAAITAAGVTRGAYMFLCYGKGFASPEDQAQAFVDAVGKLGIHDFVPALDVEFPHGVKPTGLTVPQAIEWITRAWNVLTQAYSVPPMIYTSARVWDEDLNNPVIPGMAESPAWLAKPWPYAVRTMAQIGPDADKLFASGRYDPQVPPMWNGMWWLHQYQGDAFRFPGFSATVDISRFHVLSKGEISPRVSWVQRRLGEVQNGVFDAQLETAIRALQLRYGLTVDGVIRPKTFAVIAWHNGVEAPNYPLLINPVISSTP